MSQPAPSPADARTADHDTCPTCGLVLPFSAPEHHEPGAVDITYGSIGEHRALVIVIPNGVTWSLMLTASNLRDKLRCESGSIFNMDGEQTLTGNVWGHVITAGDGQRITAGFAYGQCVERWLINQYRATESQRDRSR